MTTILLKNKLKRNKGMHTIKITCDCTQHSCEREIFLEHNGEMEIRDGLDLVVRMYVPKWMYEEALKHAELEE